VNPRKRIFLILGLLLVVSLATYLLTTSRSSDLVLLGTVDANQVLVGPKVTGRIVKLAVAEGQDVKAGELVALLDRDELAAARDASDATARSLRAQLGAARDSAAGSLGDTAATVANARAARQAALASLEEAGANLRNQEQLSARTVALAEQGILSAQDRDSAVQGLMASRALEQAARDQLAAAEATLAAAQARTAQARAALANAAAAADQWRSAEAQAVQARARLDETRIVAPTAGKVGLWAAREGEVVTAGSPIVSLVDLDQTWVYAPLPETQADAVALGDTLEVRMPSGARVQGRVLAKAAEGDFATQRDVDRIKRDIRAVRIKLWIPNPGGRYVPGMTASVVVPRRRLVRP
jgi:multidrug resistance efflux pump